MPPAANEQINNKDLTAYLSIRMAHGVWAGGATANSIDDAKTIVESLPVISIRMDVAG